MPTRSSSLSSMGCLSGIVVLDLGGPSCNLASRMLADLSADVTLLEPPNGSELRQRGPFLGGRRGVERSIPFFSTNANKRSVTMDLRTAAGAELFRLAVARADVVIEDARPGGMESLGLGYTTSADSNPRLVWASVTPFGQFGPRSSWRASDFTLQAAGGGLFLTGEPGEPPVQAGGHVAEKMTGYTAAMAVMFALFSRESTGRGQYIDISAQEALVSQMESFSTIYRMEGRSMGRDGRLYPRTYPAGIFPCRDGWVSIVAGPLHQWHALRDWIGDKRLFEERFDDLDTRMTERPYLDAIICEWTAKESRQYLFKEGHARKIPVGISQTPEDVVNDPHLQARGYFDTLEHAEFGRVSMPAIPYTMDKTPVTLVRAAPTLGEDNAEFFEGLD